MKNSFHSVHTLETHQSSDLHAIRICSLFETADAHLSPKKWVEKKNLVRMPKKLLRAREKVELRRCENLGKGLFLFYEKEEGNKAASRCLSEGLTQFLEPMTRLWDVCLSLGSAPDSYCGGT